MKAATPLGVPVITTVPLRKIVPLLICLMIVGMSYMRSSVQDDCRVSPLKKRLDLQLMRVGNDVSRGDDRSNRRKIVKRLCTTVLVA